MPDQMKRLLILFAAAGVGLLIARHFLVPPTFGKYGHYRSAAVDYEAAMPIRYAGHSACEECHDDVAETKGESYHRMVACEICHGPGLGHVEAPDEVRLEAPTARGYCPLCHGYDPARPTGFPQVDPSEHNPPDPCISCHDPHDPTPPAIPEACSACHAGIARTKAVSHHVSLECTQCHEVPEEHMINPRAARPTKPRTRAVCEACHARGAASAKSIPRIDPESHGEGVVCWQCHYPHFPEAR